MQLINNFLVFLFTFFESNIFQSLFQYVEIDMIFTSLFDNILHKHLADDKFQGEEKW